MKSRIIGFLAVAGLLVATAAAAENVTVLGGGIKGQPYQFAVGLTKLLSTHSDVSATAQSSKGMVAQARLLDRGGADFAFGIGGPIGAWAYKGVERFEKEGAKPNLRAVLSYPAGTLQWLVLADSGIKHVRDLKGKRVSLGGASSTTQTFGRILLAAHGIGKTDFIEVTPGFSEGFGSLRDGNVVAHLTVGFAPLSAVQEIASVKKIRLLAQDAAALEQVVKENGPGLSIVTAKPDIYGANQVNDSPVSMLGLFFGLSTGQHVPDDTVYKVTKTLFDNLSEFHKTAKSASNLTLEGVCEGLAFPLHPGAARYYKERGLAAC